MLDKALLYIEESLNQFLQAKFDIDERLAALTYMVRQDGSVPEEARNKLVLNLLHPHFEQASFELSFSLVLAANYDEYHMALRNLSAAMEHYRLKNVFTGSRQLALPEGVDKLIVEGADEVDLSLLKDLWAMIGARYVPSAIYQVKVYLERTQAYTPTFALNY